MITIVFPYNLVVNGNPYKCIHNFFSTVHSKAAPKLHFLHCSGHYQLPHLFSIINGKNYTPVWPISVLRPLLPNYVFISETFRFPSEMFAHRQFLENYPKILLILILAAQHPTFFQETSLGISINVNYILCTHLSGH